jgi:hypothetical protein
MKFPNTFKGIKKIWIAEMLMLVAAVLSIILLFVIAGNSVVEGDVVVINKDAVKTPTAIFGIGAAVLSLVAFLLNLIGIINCRKDDKNFINALIATLLGVVCGIVNAIWGEAKPRLGSWMEFVMVMESCYASYYVLTGVSKLSEAYPDEATKKLVDKSRNWLLGSFSLSAGLKLIVDIFNIQDGTPKTIMAIVAVLAEIISYVIYLMALNKSKKMLAK